MSHLKIYLVVFVYLFVCSSAIAQDPLIYTFTGSVNNDWENPDNWIPAYPGSRTAEGESIVYIDALCRATGMTIEIGGTLIINQGESLNLSSTRLIVSGTLAIRGELAVYAKGYYTNLGYTILESSGLITNHESVVNSSTFVIEGDVLNKGQWTNESSSELRLLSLSTFINNSNLINNGVIADYSSGFTNNNNFDNNGELEVSGAFVNAGNLTNGSTMFINGMITTKSGSNLFNHKLLDISAGATLRNSGTTYNFSAAVLTNAGSIVNSENGIIFNQGTLSTKGGENFMLERGSLLDNRPGSVVSVN